MGYDYIFIRKESKKKIPIKVGYSTQFNNTENIKIILKILNAVEIIISRNLNILINRNPACKDISCYSPRNITSEEENGVISLEFSELKKQRIRITVSY